MSKKILIADDYGDIRQMMKLLLEMYGYEAVEACNGREAVELAEQWRPDMILMDIMMPFMDGIEAMRKIRKLDGMDEVPIVAVTAYDDFYNDQALNQGFTDVLAKPLSFDELQPVLDRYLHGSAAAAGQAH